MLIALLLAFAAQDRVPWTTSTITGSPDPPPSFRAERAFPKLTFTKPVHLVPMPGHTRYVVVEEKGTLWTIRADETAGKPDLFIDLAKEIKSWEKVERCKGVASSYAIVFDPDFAKNRFCYVMYVLQPADKKPLPDGSRVSRFRVTEADPPRIDPASEEILITWLTGGHNGADLQFGNDGHLYISTGDAEDPSPPDKLRTGQDCSDLLSSILRIDVRGAKKPYAVPVDNPLVGIPGLRPEIWAYGFRNPWRMSFDRSTGRLWVGDVGWERWELIMCVERGANYGWSVVEGPTPCLPDAKRGPTPIVPVAHAIPHPEGASITGGFVYRGKRLKGIQGQYVCGDWESRRVWANPVKGNTLGDRAVIAATDARIIAFAEEADGELLILDYEKGGIHRMVPNDGARNAEFPRTLGKSGLFLPVAAQTPAPGVVAYDILAPRWADGATGQRWIAIPGKDSINLIDKNRDWPKESIWPKDSVLAKTLTLGDRKVETQILHFDGRSWNGYAYAWNAEQTDAMLAPAEGGEIDLGGGRRWRITPRAACLSCHNPWPGYSLTMNPLQLNDDRIQSLQKAGILPKELKRTKRLTDPTDEAAPIAERARSYLAVNCAHCHRFGGGGAARIDLRHDIPLDETRLVGVRPTLGAFDLTDPYIVTGGDPGRSVLLFRISKVGMGRMPHLGSEVVDPKGAWLLREWIASLPPGPGDPRKEEQQAIERLKSGDTAVIDRLLTTPSGALDLIGALRGLPERTHLAVVDRALALPAGPVRDLFERYEPPGRRRPRLGPSIRPEQVLGVKGDAARGKALFASTMIQCSKCHVIGGEETLGPDLSKIGAKYSRAQLLEAILEPSKAVDPKYAGVVLLTKGGDVLTGILVSKTEKEIVLRDLEKRRTLAAAEVERMATQQLSLMPDGLLQHLTAEEAADLLAYLESLK